MSTSTTTNLRSAKDYAPEKAERMYKSLCELYSSGQENNNAGQKLLSTLTEDQYKVIEKVMKIFCQGHHMYEFAAPIQTVYPEANAGAKSAATADESTRQNGKPAPMLAPSNDGQRQLGDICRSIHKREYTLVQEVLVAVWGVFEAHIKFHKQPKKVCMWVDPARALRSFHLRKYFIDLWCEYMLPSDPPTGATASESLLKQIISDIFDDRNSLLECCGNLAIEGTYLRKTSKLLEHLLKSSGRARVLDAPVFGNTTETPGTNNVEKSLRKFATHLSNRAQSEDADTAAYTIGQLHQDMKACCSSLKQTDRSHAVILNRLECILAKVCLRLHEKKSRGLFASGAWGQVDRIVWVKDPSNSAKAYWPALCLGIVRRGGHHSQPWNDDMRMRNEERVRYVMNRKQQVDLANQKKQSLKALGSSNCFFLVEFLGTHQFMWATQDNVVEEFDVSKNPTEPKLVKKLLEKSNPVYETAIEEANEAFALSSDVSFGGPVSYSALVGKAPLVHGLMVPTTSNPDSCISSGGQSIDGGPCDANQGDKKRKRQDTGIPRDGEDRDGTAREIGATTENVGAHGQTTTLASHVVDLSAPSAMLEALSDLKTGDAGTVRTILSGLDKLMSQQSSTGSTFTLLFLQTMGLFVGALTAATALKANSRVTAEKACCFIAGLGLSCAAKPAFAEFQKYLGCDVNGIRSITEKMGSQSPTCWGCAALATMFAGNRDNKNQFVAMGGVGSLINWMRRHGACSEPQLFGLCVLNLFDFVPTKRLHQSPSSVINKEEHDTCFISAIERTGGSLWVWNIDRRFREDDSLQKEVGRFLTKAGSAFSQETGVASALDNSNQQQLQQHHASDSIQPHAELSSLRDALSKHVSALLIPTTAAAVAPSAKQAIALYKEIQSDGAGHVQDFLSELANFVHSSTTEKAKVDRFLLMVGYGTVYSSVLAALTRSLSDRDVASAAFRVLDKLNDLAAESQLRNVREELKLNLEGVESIIKTMKDKRDLEQVQVNGCHALWCMARNAEASMANFIGAGGIALVLDAMRRHPGSGAVQYHALCVVNCCWDTLTPSSTQTTRQIIDYSKGFSLAFDAMEAHPNDKRVQQAFSEFRKKYKAVP